MAAPMWISESVEEYIRGEQTTGINAISGALHRKEVNLVGIVELLGPYLTSTETTIRARGVRLLAEILHHIPRDVLDQTEVGLLTAFFCDRLKDHHSITAHTLFGLLALSGFSNIADGNASRIIQGIYKEVQVQTLTQVDRRSVYNIISNFLQTRLTELQSLGSEFVYGYMQVMDGEKDPRNLTLAFNLVPIITLNFPFDIFAEELFEVTACYFPIDFRPQPNDPHGITREELILGLRACLAATPKFAQYCLPMLMEKMSSELQPAKLDSYQTLIACTPIYGAAQIKEYVEAIWAYCRKEVFMGSDDELEQAALDALRCVIVTMVTDSGSKEDLFNFLDNVFKECEKHIKEPGLRLIHPSSRLLQAMCSATETVCDKIMAFVLPLLMEQFHKQTQANQRRVVLDIVKGFFGICAITLSNKESPKTSIRQHKDAILRILLSVLGESNSQMHQSALGGLACLVSLPELLDDKELDLVAEHLIKISTTETEEATRKESTKVLICLAEKHTDVVKDKILPALWTELQSGTVAMDTDEKGDSAANSHVSHSDLLDDVATMATGDSTLVTHISSKLLEHLKSIGTLPDTSHEALATSKCLLKIVQRNRSNPPCLQFFHETMVPYLLRIVIRIATSTGATNENVPKSYEDMCRCLASIMRNVSQVLDFRIASDLCDSIVRLFHSGDLSLLSLAEPLTRPFEPLKVTSPWTQTQLVMLLSSIVCAVPRDVPIPYWEELVKSLLQIAIQHDHRVSSDEAAKCVAGLLNRCSAGSELDSMIECVKQELIQHGNTDNTSVRCKTVTTWIWVTKALLLRSHPSVNPFLTHLLSLLEDVDVGVLASDGFRVLLYDYEDVLNAAMHSDIKLMYKQRLFLQTLPKITEGFNNTDPAKKKHYLQALSHLLHYLPRQVLLSELPPLMPLMVQSLTQDDSALYLSTLETLHSLTADAPDIVSQHIDSLLPSVLKLTGYEANMQVRITALQSLSAITSLPHHLLFPHKKAVIRELGRRVDDRKRLVRKQAVEARTEWFLLGSTNK